MKTSEAAKGRWQEIFPEFGIEYLVTNKHRECPICSKKKFRMDDRNGTGSWICVCGNGGGVDLIKNITGLEVKSILSKIDKLLGVDTSNFKKKENPSLDYAIKLFKQAFNLKETIGQDYLKGRGIHITPQGGLKFSMNLYDKALDRKLCGLIAIASDHFSNPIFRHVTYLEGDKKANIETPKKMFKLSDHQTSAAVKLFKHQTTLGIAEGIETSLSVTQQFHCPCWATLNSSLMKRFRAPKGVKHLVIWADNDKGGTGLAAAFECGRANIYHNNDVEKVTIKWTQNRGDFNDYILEPSTINEMELVK